MWVLGIELGSSGLAASTFTHPPNHVTSSSSVFLRGVPGPVLLKYSQKGVRESEMGTQAGTWYARVAGRP